MGKVTYFSIENAPGRYFTCEKQRCTLSESGCASQYKKEKGGTSLCSGCEIGAEHAGEILVYGLPVKMCCRCGGTDKRLIHARICVSCYNRERELKLGRNAKGKMPIHAKPLRMIELFVSGLGYIKFEAVNTAEAMAVAIRRNYSVRIRPVRHPVSLMQMRLF